MYAMTNAAGGNEILVYEHSGDGIPRLVARVATGGRGSGGTATSPVDALGSQGSLLLSADGHWLFAVNAGSDEISCLEVVMPGRVVLRDKVLSGGMFPVSLALHGPLLYVLNSGGEGNITGFTVGESGRLTQLIGSTRSLQAGGSNPPSFLLSPAQVGFSPAGDKLLVTVKGSNDIHVFSLDANGVPGERPVTTKSAGNRPFSFAFDTRGHLLVAEPFGSHSVGTPNAGAVTSYQLRPDGRLKVIDASVDNEQTATCWVAVDGQGRYAYATNNASATITGYRIRKNGHLRLLDGDGISARLPSGSAPVDISVSRDGRFLYTVNAGTGTLDAFRIDPATGHLTLLGEIGGLPAADGAVGLVAD
ncbi:3-carboxymuconate cyclase [Vitiosangium sp. GDMCC 1.1324]|uniref:lactonase family protein n=1 Tax=Vitiosangium sp. (strain GDMCC 1.1324) TaxID=2138576 RepID=UPI000D3B1A80|nr:3-carboxymuconate cyclase [Vitiosangium sp. GDMCC 1.1324]PTL78590.1 3-carboxymuconate cyclase [Vitiosangium sp. GDMCC 1.1324]